MRYHACMLKKLIINNYAIIDHLELEPDANLNTVTGETGAGKSIILGALSLILGERADTSVLINKNEKSIIEAWFDVADNASFAAIMAEEELDNDAICIIRREISTTGKSRAFVNDTPVTLSVLNKLTSLLVDLQQQFGHLAMEDDNFQIDVVDAIAQTTELKKDYQSLYSKYKKISATLSALMEQQAQWQKEADYKQYLLNELTEVSFKENEIEQAELQLKQMTHAERILGVLQQGQQMLAEGEQPLVNEIKRLLQQVQSIAEVFEMAKPLQDRIASTWAELKDIADEFEALSGRVNLDASLMQQMQERIDIGYKLLKKHNVRTTQELMELQQQLQNDLKASLDLGEQIDSLISDKNSIYDDLVNKAKILSAGRGAVVPDFEHKIQELLILVGMPNARIKIVQNYLAEPVVTGMDEIMFMLDSNKSGQFSLLHKAASGGEMSRIMLCIKALTAKAMELPTLIFDEVDTGISGEAARQVGILLRELAEYHQVICITHQPQVAAKGTRHFYVYKNEEKDGRITTKVKTLTKDERVQAIAQMIGGEKPSEAALLNARELVGV